MRGKKLPLWLYLHPDQATMLRSPAASVDVALVSQPSFQQLMADMVTTMRHAQGIGLAAPQVGQSLRLAVIDRSVAERRHPLVMVNPTIVSASPDQELGEEGCLSIPKVYGLVPRAKQVRVEAFDQQGQRISIDADGLFARVLQHEIDHLNGRLFIDRATTLTSGAELLP